jgi:hypothetical protein
MRFQSANGRKETGALKIGVKKGGLPAELQFVAFFGWLVFQDRSDDEPALIHSPMLKAAQLTITYLGANGPWCRPTGVPPSHRSEYIAAVYTTMR